MHYHCEIYLKDIGNIDQQVKLAMKPFKEEWDEKTEKHNGFWDWYQVGGRWTGIHGNYDPTKDPANFKTCWLCNSTGFRNDNKGIQARKEDPTYTCNICGEYDGKTKKWKHSDRGIGIMLEHPTNWVRNDAIDVIPINHINNLTCNTLIINNIAYQQEYWDGDNWIKTDFDGNVKKQLKKLGIKNGYIVTIDYHN